MESLAVDDLAAVELRRRDRPGDVSSGEWNSRAASRLGAVRRRVATLPNLRTRCRVAIYVDDDVDSDRRATLAGFVSTGETDRQALRSPGAASGSSSHDSSRAAAAEDDIVEFSSDDDDDAYANMVCDCFAPRIIGVRSVAMSVSVGLFVCLSFRSDVSKSTRPYFTRFSVCVTM